MGTFEQHVLVCDLMKKICVITLFLYGGGLPSGRLASLQRCAEQTEWHHGRKGRDYHGQYCRYQTLLQPPVPRTPGLQAVRQQISNGRNKMAALFTERRAGIWGNHYEFLWIIPLSHGEMADMCLLWKVFRYEAWCLTPPASLTDIGDSVMWMTWSPFFSVLHLLRGAGNCECTWVI